MTNFIIEQHSEKKQRKGGLVDLIKLPGAEVKKQGQA